MFAYNLQVICVCSFVSCDQQTDLKEMADNSSHCDRPDYFVRQGERQRKSQRWGGPHVAVTGNLIGIQYILQQTGNCE